MSPQARIKIQEDITVYYHSKYGTAPSEKDVMGTFDSNKPTVYANFDEEDLPTLTSDSAKFLGWYLDQAFTIPVTVGNMEVSSVYNDDYKLNLYAKWQETIYIIESETLTGLANAVRAKTGVSGAMSPKKIGETFAAWKVEDKSGEIVDGSVVNLEHDDITNIPYNFFNSFPNIVSVNLPACTNIGSYAFSNCKKLTSVNFSVCTNISNHAFCYCSSLTYANFPACQTIGSSAFLGCQNLTYISFPVCKTIYPTAFSNCLNIVSVYFPSCTNISVQAFYSCSKLVSVSFPVCTSISYAAFMYCYKLSYVSFPKCTTISMAAFNTCRQLTSADFPVCKEIGSSAFAYCTSKLSYISFPKCSIIYPSAFYSCSQLASASFPACVSIGSYAFYYCEKMKSLYLPGSSMCVLGHSNALWGTPMYYNGYNEPSGFIYVPSSLVASYQTATNWVAYSSRITAIS